MDPTWTLPERLAWAPGQWCGQRSSCEWCGGLPVSGRLGPMVVWRFLKGTKTSGRKLSYGQLADKAATLSPP